MLSQDPAAQHLAQQDPAVQGASVQGAAQTLKGAL